MNSIKSPIRVVGDILSKVPLQCNVRAYPIIRIKYKNEICRPEVFFYKIDLSS